jgi:hypothetical protein
MKNRYEELSVDLQQAVTRLINTMASIRSDDYHAAKVNTLRQEVEDRYIASGASATEVSA